MSAPFSRCKLRIWNSEMHVGFQLNYIEEIKTDVLLTVYNTESIGLLVKALIWFHWIQRNKQV